jgi:hypothetical protein
MLTEEQKEFLYKSYLYTLLLKNDAPNFLSDISKAFGDSLEEKGINFIRAVEELYDVKHPVGDDPKEAWVEALNKLKADAFKFLNS